MILVYTILLAVAGSFTNVPNYQDENKAYGYAFATMADDVTVFSTVFSVDLDNKEQAIKQFKLDNTNKFISYCMKREDIEYNPKFKIAPGTLIELSFSKDELYEKYNKQKALANDKFFVIEGFEPLVSNTKRQQLIRN